MALVICAICTISLSELQTVQPWITSEFIDSNPDEFNRILYDCGMDSNYPVESQDVTHRNRFGNIVTGLRWVGNERVDIEWVESSYASAAAVDKSKNSKILTDLYRMKGEIEII